MPGQRSPDILQINLRLSKDLHKRLKREADRARRSLNQEMVLRLEQTFQRVIADTILEQAKGLFESAQKLHDKAIGAAFEAQYHRIKAKQEKGKK
jgi:hypothetical protein